MLFYWSKLYSKSLNSGNTYADLKKTISILILNFEPIRLEELKRFHSEWKILETRCSNVVLTDYLEVHIISLEKLEQMLYEEIIIKENSKLINWSKFLLNPDSLDKNILEENREIAMAKEEFKLAQYKAFGKLCIQFYKVKLAHKHFISYS